MGFQGLYLNWNCVCPFHASSPHTHISYSCNSMTRFYFSDESFRLFLVIAATLIKYCIAVWHNIGVTQSLTYYVYMVRIMWPTNNVVVGTKGLSVAIILLTPILHVKKAGGVTGPKMDLYQKVHLGYTQVLNEIPIHIWKKVYWVMSLDKLTLWSNCMYPYSQSEITCILNPFYARIYHLPMKLPVAWFAPIQGSFYCFIRAHQNAISNVLILECCTLICAFAKSKNMWQNVLAKLSKQATTYLVWAWLISSMPGLAVLSEI